MDGNDTVLQCELWIIKYQNTDRKPATNNGIHCTTLIFATNPQKLKIGIYRSDLSNPYFQFRYKIQKFGWLKRALKSEDMPEQAVLP